MPPKKTDDEIYQKLSQHEHILTRPDMYVGTIEMQKEKIWIFDEAENIMKQHDATWVPGLYKIFDEILVNASDNKMRDPEQKYIKVEIDAAAGWVSVKNDGEGIPVKIHGEHKMYIPEMIFGHLLTSSNYDDKEDKVTGGRNGFGAKLTNVFSKKFVVETVHSRSKKKFSMTWSRNMLDKSEPTITPVDSTEKDYTKVTFYPDFAKFGMTGFDEDIVLLMKRRVYDVAGCTDKSLKCYLNKQEIPIRTFPDYVALYPAFGEDLKKSSVISRVNERWEVSVRVSNIGQQQVSFVNSVATTRGGSHVKYITDQVVAEIVKAAKKKKATDVKPAMINQHIWVFVNCLITNPSFDTQTKEFLTTKKPSFGSTCDLPSAFIDSVLKSGLVERAVTTANSKLVREMQAKIKSSDRKRLTGIPKLEDANDAGGKYSSECTLILTEGDSAKSLCMAGLSVVGKDRFGVFPLRGKPLNVREAGLKKLRDCEEIQSVMKIMGLDINKKYTSTEGLRYGHILIMADQDHDGSHIKGLVINFIHHFWPNLFSIPGFLQQFITPIVRVWDAKRKNEPKLSFYSMPQYLEWKSGKTTAEISKLTIRYFKGLGTSDPSDGREYFANINVHRLFFRRDSAEDDDSIIKAFAKEKIEDRKQWITEFRSAEVNSDALMDYTRRNVLYREFVDKELILFSVADCERSIPSVVDGLKPGQRKILFACFKRNLVKAIKVSQLAGYVSEQSAYHHGEASLHSTIVGLAQDFVGSNNIPLLKPEGTFGSRLAGGKDCAAARYIFTALAEVTRDIFNKSDDYIVEYKDDDGQSVEPHFYVPILPMVLVNGTAGIGTGFSTNIPNYSPLVIIDNLRRLLDGKDVERMSPWYVGFKGEISEKEKGKFISKGRLTIQHDGVVTVSELPIGHWTNNFKKSLEDMMEKDLVITFRECNTDSSVDVDIMLHPEVLRAWQAQGILEEKLGLVGHLHATNIIAFNIHGQITKYADAEAVLKEFYLIRLDYYKRRKAYLISELEYDCKKLENMVRFVREVVNGTIIVTKRKKKELLNELRTKGFHPFPPKQKKKVSATTITTDEGAGGDDDDNDAPAVVSTTTTARIVGGVGDTNRDYFTALSGEQDDDPQVATAAKDYDYLLGMKIWSLTIEMIEHLRNQLKRAEGDLSLLQSTSSQEMWRHDLDALEVKITRVVTKRTKFLDDDNRKKKVKRQLDGSRIKVPVLSEQAKKVIEPSKKLAKVLEKQADGGGNTFDMGDNDDVVGTVQKPKPKPKPKKRAKKDSDDFSDPTTSSDFDSDNDSDDSMPIKAVAKKRQAGAKSSRALSDDSDTDQPPKQKAPSKPKAPAAKKASPKKASPKKTSPKKSAIPNLFDDDDFGDFGLTALVGKPPVSTVKKEFASPSINLIKEDDEDDDLLFGSSAASPLRPPTNASKPSTPAKKPSPPKTKRAPAAKKTSKKKDAESDDDDSSSPSESESSSPSTSDWTDSE